MIRQNDNKLYIKLGRELTEDNLDVFYNELKTFDFDKKKYENVVIELNDVLEVDFFGYQTLYFFCDYLVNSLNYPKEKVVFYGKTKNIIEFEEKMGISL
ncbi:MAG: hypothetical protein A2Y34_02440 [Spirochaetes bacterium GWC1_27_15]|nr:MAG: hypothetical protein A2Z98_15015 [Spirochaetes bacterium GWB1_27_13]OHD28225.1 MAG: hypothetical protein A2Y34_02440 [Spirochaetes bacterium GWC1_27_15]